VEGRSHNFNVECSLVNIQWMINLSFNIAHLTLFFWPLTVNEKNGFALPWD
jgi:hypothetical protein